MKNRLPNVKIYFVSIIVLCFSLFVIVRPVTQEISMVAHSHFLFTYLPLILSVATITLQSIYLISKRNCASLITKFIKVFTIILTVYVSLFLIEFLLLSVIRSFIVASSLTKIPQRSEFITSVAYIVLDYAPDFLKGVVVTLELSLFGTLIGLIIGLLLVILRTLTIQRRDSELMVFLKKAGILFAKGYVNLFRGTPMMVQAVIIYYLLPTLIASAINLPVEQVDKFFTPIVAGFVVVSLNTAAYLTEVLRGGIESIDKGQMEAARSLGLSYWQAMFKIILPQALKNSLPAIGNEFVINIKDTSVLNIIGVAELFFMTQDAKFKYYRNYEPFIIAGIIYLFLTMTTSKILTWLEKRMDLETRALPSSN